MTISVLIADDHALVRKGIRAILAADNELEIIGEAADGLEAVKLAEAMRPNILVLDLIMPNLNGLDALRIIQQRSPCTRVVMLSMYADSAYVLEALRCGASGYVLKGGQARELLDAVRAVAAGHSYFSPKLAQYRGHHNTEMAPSAGIDPHDMLTPREREVLQQAAEGRTCREIGASLHISERTAEMHRSHLMRKLGLKTQTELVRYALHRGLLPPNISP